MTFEKDIFVYDTIYCSDSVEFSPFSDKVAVGTYELKAGMKQGSILTFCGVKQEEGGVHADNDILTSSWELQSSVSTHAVLDMKWSHRDPILAVADSNGDVTLYKDDLSSSSSSDINQWGNGRGTLNLSIDVSNRIDRSGYVEKGLLTYIKRPMRLCVSQSDGSVSLLCVSESEIIECMHWNAHKFEAWIAAFNYWDTNIVYSGADDGLFKGHDTRMNCCAPMFSNSCHESGVTCIQSSPHDQNLVVTGSYDEHVRLFDIRFLSNKTQPIQKYHVGGGGIWRLKWHPYHHHRVLAACMHEGFRIFSVSSDGIDCLNQYHKHSSLAYGADWSFNKSRKGRDIVGTSSFYDHEFRLWEATFE